MTLIKWWIPPKVPGKKLANPGWGFPPELVQALKDAAQAETIRQGKKVAPATIAANLILRNGNVFIPVRSGLIKNYTQLKRETAAHETSNDQPSEAE